MSAVHLSSRPDELPALPGTYALLVWLGEASQIQVGRLGCFEFPVGWYVYVGSARGAGGLAARVRHHWQPTPHPHWHIDFLRRVAFPVQVAWQLGSHRRECLWSSRLGTWPGARRPVAGFGASDCDCLAHLWYLTRRPDLKRLIRPPHT